MHTKWADNIIMKMTVDICLFTGSQFMYTSTVNRQPVSEYNNDLDLMVTPIFYVALW